MTEELFEQTKMVILRTTCTRKAILGLISLFLLAGCQSTGSGSYDISVLGSGSGTRPPGASVQ